MSTTDKTESLYDSVSTPADAEEQSGTVAPAANQAPDQEHGTEPAVAAPAEAAAAEPAPAVAETPSVQAVPVEALAAKTPADTSAVTAPADGPKSVPSVPSGPQAPQQAAVETSTAPAEPSASAPEPSAAEDTATTDTEPPAAQSQTASAPAAAPRPIPTPQSVPSPERAAVSAGEAATVAWKKDGDAAQEATRQTAVTASNGAARRAAQASAAAEPAQQEAQSRDDQAAQAEQAAQEAQVDQAAKAEQAAQAEQAEQQEAEQRAQEKAERDRRLGTVRADEQPETVVAATVPRPTTDRFAGSVGLFVLRVVTTALVGVFGFQALTQRQPVIDAIAKIGVPRANLVAWGLAGLLLLVAAMILFGLGTRVAGFILAALGVLSLVFVKWGAFNPFHQGQPGFSGDIDLVLAAIGWALLFVGAGGWSLDAGIRRSRAQKKLDGQV